MANGSRGARTSRPPEQEPPPSSSPSPPPGHDFAVLDNGNRIRQIGVMWTVSEHTFLCRVAAAQGRTLSSLIRRIVHRVLTDPSIRGEFDFPNKPPFGPRPNGPGWHND